MHRWRLKAKVTEERLMRDSSESDLESIRSLEVTSVTRKLNCGGHVVSTQSSTTHLSRLKCTRRDADELEDLPDGSCFNRSMQMTLTPSPDALYSFGTSETSLRVCQYTGSFCVTASDQSSRAEFVKTQLEQMRGTTEKKPVLLVVSLTGVKICSPQTKSVLMAHALRRISYATCDPAHCQFSFLSREPKGHFSRQFCHSFVTDTPKQAEELNTLVGNAFRMAYAHQLPPSFLELIGKQRTLVSDSHLLNREVNGNFMTGILNEPSAAHCRQDDPAVTPEKVWAKTTVNNIRHHDPLIDNVIGTNGSPARTTPKLTLPTQSPFSTRASSNDLWSPSSSASSCEDNATPAVSPTEVNSCTQMREKPPLVKTLDTWTEERRPKSGSYVNEGSCWSGAPEKSTSKVQDTRQELIPLSPKKVQLQSPLQVRVPEEKADVESVSKRSSSSTPSLSDSSEDGRSKRSSQSSTSPPPLPERHDSLQPQLEEEKELRGAPWFQAGIPREIALEVLAQEPVGSFMVRESTSKPGCYALSLRVPREFQQAGIAHYLIMRTNRGFKIKGFTKEFSSLTALITHHSVMPELLPCPLSLSRYNPVFRKQDSSDDVVDIDDPDYNLLSDFRKVMADLKT